MINRQFALEPEPEPNMCKHADFGVNCCCRVCKEENLDLYKLHLCGRNSLRSQSAEDGKLGEKTDGTRPWLSSLSRSSAQKVGVLPGFAGGFTYAPK